MAPLNETLILAKLRAHGAAEHVIRGGSVGLIATWAHFVAQVERGYSLGLADYRNDLDVRGLIAVVDLDSHVIAEDSRFRAVLIPGGSAVWQSDVPHAFWVRGYPANASGQLLADLQEEGLA